MLAISPSVSICPALLCRGLRPTHASGARAPQAAARGPALPPSSLRLLLPEHGEVGILVRHVLLVFRIADEVDAQALQPPGLNHRPFTDEADIVLLVRGGQANVVGAVV